MGRPKRRRSDLAGRPAMRSPGRPPGWRREHRQRFWAAIARGATSEAAGVEAGVSPAVGVRWFREGGGMPSVTQTPVSGRYLSFAEREEIAILRAQGCGVREIARQLGRSPSTISCELRRNAATRGGYLEYRASTAQWHADRRARRPKLDPEYEALLADSVGLALLVVLETLTPAERLSFVLHDTFSIPFEEIAPIVGRSPAAARQLASRPRRRVQNVAPEAQTDISRQRELVDAFLAAARAGDFDALIAVLDPAVVFRVDGGGVAPPAREPMIGAAAAAQDAITFARAMAQFARPALVNGTPGLVITPEGRPVAVLGFTIRQHRIAAIDAIADPPSSTPCTSTNLHDSAIDPGQQVHPVGDGTPRFAIPRASRRVRRATCSARYERTARIPTRLVRAASTVAGIVSAARGDELPPGSEAAALATSTVLSHVTAVGQRAATRLPRRDVAAPLPLRSSGSAGCGRLRSWRCSRAVRASPSTNAFAPAGWVAHSWLRTEAATQTTVQGRSWSGHRRADSVGLHGREPPGGEAHRRMVGGLADSWVSRGCYAVELRR